MRDKRRANSGRGRWARQIAAITCLLASGRAAQARAVTPSLAEADRQWARQSYAKALPGYVAAQAAGQVPAARLDDVAYRVAVCWGKAQVWDRALQSGRDFVSARRGTVWEAKGLYWLGRLYLDVPHEGYRVGTRLYRGADVPKGEGEGKGSANKEQQKTNDNAPRTTKPVRVNLTEPDMRNALDALEAAHLRYAGLALTAGQTSDAIQEDFDLIRMLQARPGYFGWAQKREWLPPGDANWKLDVSQTYDPAWPQPKKTLFLFAQIEKLAANTPHSRALALLGRALWLRQYHMQMRLSAVKYEGEKAIRIPYPYQDRTAEAELAAIVRSLPNDPIRDQAQYLRAIWMAQDGKLADALAALRSFVADRPKSPWASDAKGAIAGLLRPEVALETVGQARPGALPKLRLNYRNARAAQLELWQINLPRLLTRQSGKTAETRDWTDLPALLGYDNTNGGGKHKPETLAMGLARCGAKRLAAWSLKTPDGADMRTHQKNLTAPTRQAGAYIVVASVDGQRAGLLFTVSDLAVVDKRERGGGLYFVANALSGRPVAGAALTVKQWWEKDSKSGATLAQARTNGDGLASVALARAPGRDSFQMAALAQVGQRYALSAPQSYYENQTANEPFKVYSTTDRAVYRPQQTVQFRQLLLRRLARAGSGRGDLRPVAGRRARVVVTDPQNNMVYKQITPVNAWGSVSGHFALKANAPLGEYSIAVTLVKEKGKANNGDDQEALTSAGSVFRVEEYKKPEFEVTVTPGAERVRLGQTAKAKIHAAYYFGGPVPNARVTYRVYRNLYAATYRFPKPYDYLGNADANRGADDVSYRRGDVVKQGTARLDAKGEAEVSFDTRADGERWKDTDLTYTVEADIQDASRRTISGTGALKATKHDVAVFLDFPHGYATQGDRVDVEIKTLNPSDQPVSVFGQARVYQQPTDPKGKETEIDAYGLTTDAQGHAVVHWPARFSGRFRIEFQTTDGDHEAVKGEQFVWVDGPELRSQRFLYQGVYLGVKDPYAAEGTTAHVLLVTPAPNCAVLLTREAGGQILEKRVVRIEGRSVTLALPITGRDAPNVFVSAVMLRDGERFQADQELFVPPVRQLARVTVTPDKARYQPGETARLLLQASDENGKPLRAELSVAVADAALNYIQKDYAPDIRAWFYGDRRTQEVETSGSAQTFTQTVGELTRPVPTFKSHIFIIPDGMGTLDIGDASRQRSGSFLTATSRGGNDTGGTFYITDQSNLNDETRTVSDAKMEVEATQMSGKAASTGMPPGMMGGAMPDPPANPGAGIRRHVLAIPVGVREGGKYRDRGSERGTLTGKMENAPYEFDAQKIRLADATIRSDFRDTAFWTPSVVTDANGRASVTVKWPDNLTQWRAKAVGSAQSGQVGMAEASVTTKKDLLVQLETPRFLVERDTAVFSAVVHNDTDQDARVRVRMDLDNADVVATEGEGEGKGGNPQQEVPAGQNSPSHRLRVKTSETWVDIPKGGQQRVDWIVRAQHEGAMHCRMTAQSDRAGDAAQMELPVLVHGVERAVTQAAQIKADAKGADPRRPQNVAQMEISLPEARKPGSSRLVVTLSPSLAGVMLGALPYLADYPYGCVEQTMSRFLPSVIAAKTLKDLGYNLSDLQKAARAHQAALTKQTGPGKVENSPYTYQGTGSSPQKGAFPYQPSPINPQPVFDAAEMSKRVKEGMARLKDMQHSDGGWGWWKDDSSDPYMTAYVVYGLIQCERAGYKNTEGVSARGINYLYAHYLEETDLQQMAYQARVLALVPNMREGIANRALKRIYPQRAKLSAYGKALLALALQDMGKKEQARVTLENLQNTAREDKANGTVHWDDLDGNWWRWYNNKVETNATILQAHVAIAPNGRLAPMLVKWLVANRRGTVWQDTRDTALAVNALSDWMRVRKELAPDYTLTVNLGGRVERKYRVTRANALWFDNTFVVNDDQLQTGAHTLTVTRQGQGACYISATTTTFSLEEPIAATSHEIAVTRRYYRLVPGTASGEEETTRHAPQATKPETASTVNPFLTGQYDLLDQGGDVIEEEGPEQGPKYERVELKPGDILNSGDLLEVELALDAKNDYDYMLFEDIKPAGCEPVELKSGAHEGQGVYSNMELRDQKVAFFVAHLEQGRRVLSYRLRAETPGAFHALPTNGYAMYAPEVRSLSDEARVTIRDEATADGAQ